MEKTVTVEFNSLGKTAKAELKSYFGEDVDSVGEYGCTDWAVSDEEMCILEKLGNAEGKVSCDDVKKAIENGSTELEKLHKELSEKFYYMCEHYWLFEADIEYDDEILHKYFQKDSMSGVFNPDMVMGMEYDWENTMYDKYVKWVRGHVNDHEFVAERAGCSLEGCREYEVSYTIQL